MPTDGCHSSLTENQAHHGTGKEFIKGRRCMYIFLQSSELAVDLCDVALVTIDALPDLALLTIFDFYMDKKKIETWQTLVHVCRKWRNVVFGSPRRLKLRLHCNARTLMRRKLDVWPLLPIVIRSGAYEEWGVDYLIRALGEHNDRVCGIDLHWVSREVIAAMQQPFPALTRLRLQQGYKPAPVVSALFLGGSVPGLQSLVLRNIPFPGLPKLVLSATHLVNLQLLDIPQSGYFSPEAMATSLSALTRLKKFRISFQSHQSHLGMKSQCPFLQTRALLPALTELWFGGVHEYFEDLVAQIDVPLLNKLCISFSTFHIPQLIPFISRIPKSKAYNEANILFSNEDVKIRFQRTFGGAGGLEILCEEPDRQRPWMARLCRSSLPQALILMVEHLYILHGPDPLNWDHLDDETENDRWLELLSPFTSVKCLYIQEAFDDDLTPVLQGLVGERVSEVLPALQTLFLEDPREDGRFREAIEPFVSARQLSGHPIVVSHWDGE